MMHSLQKYKPNGTLEPYRKLVQKIDKICHTYQLIKHTTKFQSNQSRRATTVMEFKPPQR